MRKKKLLAFLLCLAMAFQLVPFASAEEGFSVYAPDEISIAVGGDGTVSVSPENPAIYNGSKAKAAAVTKVEVAAKDGWTLVPFDKQFPEGDASQSIGVNLNGVDIDPNGLLDLSAAPWVIAADGKLPLDFRFNLPNGLPREDVPGVLNITYTFDWAEEDRTHTLTPIDGEHGAASDKTPIQTDKHGVVQDNLPGTTPEDGYELDKWVYADSGEEVKPGDVLDSDVTIKPVFQPKGPEFSVDYENGLMLPESSNTATFKWSNVPDDFELAEVTSSDPSIAEVSEVFDSANESQKVEVKAFKRGVAKFTGVSTTGETADFDVLVSELNGEEKPSVNINGEDKVKPGDVIDPDDITVSIPTVTPDGETEIVTITPGADNVSGNEIGEGKNVVSADVDANGVDITVNLVITVKTPPSDPSDNTHTITIDQSGGSSEVKTDRNGTVPELPQVTPDEGSAFDKWVNEAGDEVRPGDTITEDITITPTFKPDENYKVYTITIEPGSGGHAADESPLKTDSNGTVPALPAAIPDSGHKFDKWVDEGMSEVKPGDILTRDTAITPLFVPDKVYTVTPIDGDHGSPADKTPFRTDANGVVLDSFPGVKPASGYKFEKWVYAGSGGDARPGDILDHDVEVKPAFKSAKTYAITPVDGTDGSANDKTIRYTDENGVVQNNLPGATPKSGYAFVRWEDESGREIKPGVTLTHDVTITPVFTKQPHSVSVRFKYIGGNGTDSGNTLAYPVRVEVEGYTPQVISRGTPKNDYLGGYAMTDDMSFTCSIYDWSNGDRTSFNNVLIYADGKFHHSNMIADVAGRGSRMFSYTLSYDDFKSYNTVEIGLYVDSSSKYPNSGTYSLTPVDGEHCTVPNKSAVKTNSYRVVTRLPSVVPDDGYEFVCWTVGGKELYVGDYIDKDKTIKPVCRLKGLGVAHTVSFADGEHGAVLDKTAMKTSKSGVFSGPFPAVSPEEGYAFVKWVNASTGAAVKTGDQILTDITVKPVFAERKRVCTVYFENANYYTLSSASPLTTGEDGRIPWARMPGVTPNFASHYFDGGWVNADTGETVDASTVLQSDITVKPAVNCLFTENSGAVSGFSDYAKDKDVSSIVIPNNIMGKTVTRIGDYAFCAQSHMVYDDGTIHAVPNTKAKEVKHVVIQEGIFALGTEAFGSDNILEQMNLESISLPDGLKVIDDEAFYECRKLASITIPDTVTTIGDAAFWDNYNLSSVQLGSSVKSLGYRAFIRCTALRSISLPSSLRTIDKSCFESSGLESVAVPDGCSVGEDAFIFCENLKTATLGEGTTSLNGTFQRCSNLKTVRLSSSIKSINANAFYYCPNLAYIYMKGSRNSVSGAPWSSSRTHPTVVWNSK